MIIGNEEISKLLEAGFTPEQVAPDKIADLIIELERNQNRYYLNWNKAEDKLEDINRVLEKVELELYERSRDDEANLDIALDWYTDGDSGVSEITGFITRMLDREGNNIVYYGYGETLILSLKSLSKNWKGLDERSMEAS